ncbi:MAG: hypothetical protein ACJ79E_03985 [Anaeromyxobacteraceae bacterium]
MSATAAAEEVRFPIRFDRTYAALSRALFLAPSASHVSIAAGEVRVRMAWAFRAAFPKSAVRSVTPGGRRPLSRGVHGFGGRWLVNGSGDGIVVLELAPEQRARVLGFPVRLRQLAVSVEEPEALAEALGR